LKTFWKGWVLVFNQGEQRDVERYCGTKKQKVRSFGEKGVPGKRKVSKSGGTLVFIRKRQTIKKVEKRRVGKWWG